METITLKVDDGIFEKFQWLMSHFSNDEVNIVNEIDVTKFPKNNFDFISYEKMEELNQISNDYKNGNKDDFEEYII